MTWKNIVAGLLCVDFALLTAWTLVNHGLNPISWVEQLGGNLLAACILADLLLALGVAMVWMIKDAKQKGRAVWGYVILTLMTGSVGPLLYIALGREKSLSKGESLSQATPASQLASL